MKALPGVAPFSKSNNALAGVASAAADRIPDNVLNHPIIGEARRFDGTVAPNPSWMLAQGQQIQVSENRPLFSMLGSIAGGDGKTVFALPKPRLGYIIAVGGMFPSSPAALANSGRKMGHADGLGEGAIVPMRHIRPERRGLVEQRELSARALRVGPGRWTPLSGEMETRISAVTGDARTDALARLGPASRNAVAGVTDAVTSGRMSVVDAIGTMTRSLNGTEAAALLDVNDRMFAAFRSGWAGAAHPNAQLEAARFVVSVAFTPEQLNVIRLRS